MTENTFLFLEVMNDEKRRLQSYLLDKNLSTGQLLSLFSTIDTGVTVDQIINSIQNLGNVTLSNTCIAKIRRISKNRNHKIASKSMVHI